MFEEADWLVGFVQPLETRSCAGTADWLGVLDLALVPDPDADGAGSLVVPWAPGRPKLGVFAQRAYAREALARKRLLFEPQVCW